MSAQHVADNSRVEHVHANPAAHGDAHAHGTRRSYLTGFALSVVLTAIPFWLVMSGVISDPLITTLLIMGLGMAQILVHMVYFLHMNTRSEGGWTFMAAMFTIIIIVIALSGSLWVMYHLNTNMMPAHDMNPASMI